MNAWHENSILWALGRVSLQTSILILVVFVAAWLCRRYLTPRWRCALWLLVMARLCLPVSIGSVVSVFNLLPRAAARIENRAESAALLAFNPLSKRLSNPTAGRVDVPRVLGEQVVSEENVPRRDRPTETSFDSPTLPAPVAFEASLAANSSPALVSRRVHWSALLFGGWLAGMGVLALYVAVTTWRLTPRLAQATRITEVSALAVLEDACRQMRVRIPPMLAESAYVHSPVVHGLWPSRILLPAGFTSRFSPDELRFIFLHELAHLKRRDLLVNWVVTLLQMVYWFNPLVWLGFARWRVDRELACDALVLDTAGAERNREYGRTILRLLETFAPRTAVPGLVGILEDQRQLRQRIGMIADFRPGRRFGLMSMALLAGLAFISLTDATAPRSVAEQVDSKVEAAANPEAKPAVARETYYGADPTPTGETNALTRTVTVTVTDATTEEPITNAEISIDGPSDPPQPRRLTDAQGQFILGVPPPSQGKPISHFFTLVAQHPNYASRAFEWGSMNGDVHDYLSKEVTIALEPGIKIGGLVRDELGKPLPGVRVLLSSQHYPRVPGLTSYQPRQMYERSYLELRDQVNPAAMTDANGRWTFTHFPADLSMVDLTLVRPDGASQDFSTFESPVEMAFHKTFIPFQTLRDQTALFNLEDGVTVRGVVVDEKGRPLDGVWVREGYGMPVVNRVSEFRTRGGGRFECAHRGPRQWIYTASAEGRATVSTVAQVKPGMGEVRLVMPPAKPLQIRVTDEEGQALAGVRVSPDGHRNEGQILDWEGLTDAQGQVVWSNAPSSPVIYQAAHDRLGVRRNFHAVAGDPVTHVVLAIHSSPPPTLRVKAMDARNRQPVSVDWVSVLEMDHSTETPKYRVIAEPRTNEFKAALQGVGRLIGGTPDLLPLLIKFEAKGYEPCFTTFPGGYEGDLDLELALVPGTVERCTVLLPDNRPAEDTSIWIRPHENAGAVFSNAERVYYHRGWFEYKTYLEGLFTPPAVPEELPVVIVHDKGFLQTTIAELKRNRIVRLEAFGRIEGHLKVQGQPKADVTIELSNFELTPFGPMHVSYHTTSGTNGIFTFAHVPPGEYLIFRQYAQYIGQTIVASHQMPIRVKPGETLKLQYGESGREITGSAAADPAGTPVDWLHDRHLLVLKQAPLSPVVIDDYTSVNAFIEARNQNFNSPAYLRHAREARNYELIFQRDGTFHADDAPPGRYELRLKVTKPRKPYQRPDFDLPEDELGSLVREVVVPPGDQGLDLGLLKVAIREE